MKKRKPTIEYHKHDLEAAEAYLEACEYSAELDTLD